MLISYHIISFDPGASSSESPQCAFEGLAAGSGMAAAALVPSVYSDATCGIPS